MFVGHGVLKLIGGPDTWSAVGHAMSVFGVGGGYAAWGFVAGLAEAGSGALVALGLFFRPACLPVLFTMGVAAATHAKSFTEISHPVEAGIVFLALLVSGPGRYSLAARRRRKRALATARNEALADTIATGV